MKTFVKKVMKQLTCIFKGHEAKTMLLENDIGIFNTGCARCGCHLGLPIWWYGLSKLYPLNCITLEQKNEYDQEGEIWIQEKRDSVKIQIMKEQDLVNQNYVRHEWTDKNSSDDTFDTLKFIEYKKEINEHFFIEIDFAFEASEPDAWRSTSVLCGLFCSSGESVPLPIDIDKIEEIYGLLKQNKK